MLMQPQIQQQGLLMNPDNIKCVPNKLKPLEQLVTELEKEFMLLQPEGFYGNSDKITDLMTNYINHNNDWKEYVFFCPVRYTRNLIARNDQFELMVICWRKGQPSPIHNHEDQRCWMGCVEGQLQETYFVFNNTMQAHGSGQLVKSHQHPIENGTVGYITDEIALHMIESSEPESISIHLYSKPITECNIYCPITGSIQRRKLGYYTQYKQKLLCHSVTTTPSSNDSTPSNSPTIPTLGDCSSD